MLTMPKTPEELAKHAAYMRVWHQRNPRKTKSYQLKRLYGLTLEDFDAMLESQGGVCGCCGNEFSTQHKRDMMVDHDHGTGRFRGIVCAKCNYILGRHGHDIAILHKAVAYLERLN